MTAQSPTPPEPTPSRAFKVGRFTFTVDRGCPTPPCAERRTTRPAEGTRGEALGEALSRVWAEVWQHDRYGKATLREAELALAGLYSIRPPSVTASTIASAVPLAHVQECRDNWQAAGISSAAIQMRLRRLARLGVNIAGLMPPRSRVLKWWLRPQEKARLAGFLTQAGTDDALAFRDYVEMLSVSGMGVDELVRLEVSDVDLAAVPPTITLPAAEPEKDPLVLPLPPLAVPVLRRRVEALHLAIRQHSVDWDETRLWPHPITWATVWFSKCRIVLGIRDSTATLRCLKYSAARHLHVDLGMPIEAVQHFMRHKLLATTVSYVEHTRGVSP